MTINDLINVAAEAYYETYLLRACWDFKDQCVAAGTHGDTLATFIVRELSETFDTEATTDKQLQTARKVMQNAANDVLGVVAAMENYNPDENDNPEEHAHE